MLGLRNLLTGEGRTFTVFLPPVALAYVAWKHPRVWTARHLGIFGWHYTGFPTTVYWIVAAVALIVGSLVFILGSAGTEDEEGDGVPLRTKQNPVINHSVTLYGILDAIMLPFLTLRFPSGDYAIILLFTLSVVLWLTMFYKRAFIDRIQDDY